MSTVSSYLYWLTVKIHVTRARSRVIDAGVVFDLRFGRFDETYACDLAELVRVQVRRVFVLVRILPVGIIHDVVLAVRMDDAPIEAVHALCVLILQSSDSLALVIFSTGTYTAFLFG